MAITATRAIRVLIVDDSRLVQMALKRIFEAEQGIEVAGVANDPYEARELIVKLQPDVVTLDVEMPRMDGLTFLKKLMRFHPVPVVMLSSITKSGSERAIEGLRNGAIEVLCKPSGSYGVGQLAPDLCRAVRAASVARLRKLPAEPAAGRAAPAANSPGAAPAQPDTLPIDPSKRTRKLLAIGSSTGGPDALRNLLRPLPATCPPVVITQHIPASYSGQLATSLNRESALTVKEAQGGEILEPGHAYLAPGGRHMRVSSTSRAGGGISIEVFDAPAVQHCKPSVDILFESVAEVFGSRALGVILTGMGADGAVGLKKMHDKGSPTCGQNESSCVVYGMPKAAKSAGAVDIEIPLEQIPAWITKSAVS